MRDVPEQLIPGHGLQPPIAPLAVRRPLGEAQGVAGKEGSNRFALADWRKAREMTFPSRARRAHGA
jgi:hypothetical protein